MVVRNDRLDPISGINASSNTKVLAGDWNDTMNKIADIRDALHFRRKIESTVTDLTYASNTTLADSYIVADDFTINSGVTVTLDNTRGGTIIFCHGTCTIAGTLTSLGKGKNSPPVSNSNGVTSVAGTAGSRSNNGFLNRGGGTGERDSSYVQGYALNSLISNTFEDSSDVNYSSSMLNYIRSFLPSSPINIALNELKNTNFNGGAGTGGSIRVTTSGDQLGTTGGSGGGGILIIAKDIIVSGTIVSNGGPGHSDSVNNIGGSCYISGAGGGSGAPIILYAHDQLTLTGGTLNSIGGNGGNAYNRGFVGGTVNGGDGGHGGVIIYYYKTKIGTPTTNLTGGTGGNPVLSGVVGSAGVEGSIIDVPTPL